MRRLAVPALLLVIALLVVAVLPATALAQERSGEWAWSPILEYEGVTFSYILYPQQDGRSDSIVIRIENDNDHPVTYRFEMVFRSSEGQEEIEEIEGVLAAGEMTTGDAEGLYWSPFSRGERIIEIGLRGYRIDRR